MIIALSGKRKSGKTTSGQILKDLHSSFVRLGFADALKAKLSSMYNIPLEDLYSNTHKEKYRPLMQTFAETCRTAEPNIWVDMVAKTLDEYPGNDFVIEDLRYLNELEMVLKRKGMIVQVVTDTKVRQLRGMVPDIDVDNHISENDVASITPETIRHLGGAVIYNNKTVEDLRAELKIILRKGLAQNLSSIVGNAGE